MKGKSKSKSKGKKICTVIILSSVGTSKGLGKEKEKRLSQTEYLFLG